MRRIVLDDLRGDAVALLLEEHLRDMRAWSPSCSVHTLDLDKLRRPEISFWTMWDGDALLGFGALKDLGQRACEIKSMRTATAHQRKGVGSAMLDHILRTARERGMRQIYLETGSQPAFSPARALYASRGFNVCEPFADYTKDDHSCFMALKLIT